MAERKTTDLGTQVEELAEEQKPTVYDRWHKADGLHDGEAEAKWITFKHGFVRVRKGILTIQEGWAYDNEKTFYVPAWHSCEVLGSPDIKFTRA